VSDAADRPPRVSRHRPPPDLAPDHLVVAALSLDAGVSWVEERLGVQAMPGGRHLAMGTRNAVVGLGPRCYLEVIAIDPHGAAPNRPRWFDLDEPRMRARLAEGPALIHWVVRTPRIDDDAETAGIDPGEILAMQRDDYAWRIGVPADGHLAARGLVPTLIQWSTREHPADRLPDRGVRLVALAGEHPDPAPARAALARLGLSDMLKVTYGQTPRLAAMLRTPRGVVTL
jgi:glyoxalase-like protein